MATMHEVEPVTIVLFPRSTFKERRWLAFNLYEMSLPRPPYKPDGRSSPEFWKSYFESEAQRRGFRLRPVGRGNTPDESLADLEEKLIEDRESGIMFYEGHA